jgi:monothiol glutaredoxin
LAIFRHFRAVFRCFRSLPSDSPAQHRAQQPAHSCLQSSNDKAGPQKNRNLRHAATGWNKIWDNESYFRVEGCVMSDVQNWIKETVTQNPVVLFMKGTAQFPQCGFSGRAVQILKACGVQNLVTVNVLEDAEVRQGIKDYSSWPTIPQLYVKGEFIGGSDIMGEMFENGELQTLLKD